MSHLTVCINYRSQQLPGASPAVHAHHAQDLKETEASQRGGGEDVTLATGWHHSNGGDEHNDVWGVKEWKLKVTGSTISTAGSAVDSPAFQIRSLHLSITFKTTTDALQAVDFPFYLYYPFSVNLSTTWKHPIFVPLLYFPADKPPVCWSNLKKIENQNPLKWGWTSDIDWPSKSQNSSSKSITENIISYSVIQIKVCWMSAGWYHEYQTENPFFFLLI